MRNIVARWRGSGPAGKKARLLSAHYDSVARGPGAGDDASGVAAILESLRALKAGAGPERDVIVLINEGEEIGLFGAEVFSEEHPWAKDVGVVLNLDARGNRGPSYMFETSEGNGWLIEQLARALPHPMATSLTVEVYRRMPNDTDLTIYKKHGMPGLNFAFVGGLSDYHTPEDTPANLDPSTLQHQGENLLAMTRHLVRLDLDDVRRDDVVYFAVLQRFVAIYPEAWVMPLMVIAVLGFIGVTTLGIFKKRVRVVEVAAGFGMFLLAAVAAYAVVFAAWTALNFGLGGRVQRLFRYDTAILAGFSAASVLIGGFLFTRAGRWWSWEGLGLGVLSWWLAATVATSLWLPGGSYCARLADAGAARRPGRGLRDASGQHDRGAGGVAGGHPAPAGVPDDLARILRRVELEDGGPADGPGLDDRGRAGAPARPGRGDPASRSVRDRPSLSAL